MLREAAKHLLQKKQLHRYERLLKERMVSYTDWEHAREKADHKELPSVKKVAEDAHLHVFPYSEIRALVQSGQLRRIEEEDIAIFVSDHGRLSKQAKQYIVCYFSLHPEIDLLYGDEDKLTGRDVYEDPFFKPDWSPNTYLFSCYIGSVFAARGKLLGQLPTLSDLREDADAGQAADNEIAFNALAFLESQDKVEDSTSIAAGDALFFLLAEAVGGFEKRTGLTFPVGHIDEILFHRDPVRDSYYTRRRKFKRDDPLPEGDPLVSIIIPSKDNPDILKQCLVSLARHCNTKATRIRYEIIIVDNGSQAQTRVQIQNFVGQLRGYEGIVDIRYLYRFMEFNFSAMCNLGAKASRGQYLLFLNDDIEAMVDGWLGDMVLQAMKPLNGAVGAKLLYPRSDLIQHAGIANVRRGPVHKLQKMHDKEVHYFGYNRGIHDMIAVTGACLMVDRNKFAEVEGFSENLAVAFNDVDLCYKLLEQGYYNVCCNHFFLFHHESFSRGIDTEDAEKMERLAREYRVLMKAHKALFKYDPFYSAHLVEDEHVHQVMRNEDHWPPEELEIQKVTLHENGLPPTWEDPCLQVGVEYSGLIDEWYDLAEEEGLYHDLGYYIKGYSFVIGSDNAMFERRVLFRKAEGPSTAPRAVGHKVWSCPLFEYYRRDVDENLEGQTNVLLTGFKARLAKDALPAGTYQVGVMAIDKTGRQRITRWAPNLLRVTS